MCFPVRIGEHENIIILYHTVFQGFIKSLSLVDVKKHMLFFAPHSKECDQYQCKYGKVSDNLSSKVIGFPFMAYRFFLRRPTHKTWLTQCTHHCSTGIHTFKTVDTLKLKPFSDVNMRRTNRYTRFTGRTLSAWFYF